MYDFGTSDGNSNAINFGVLTALDAPAAYTMSAWVELQTLVAGGTAVFIFSKRNDAADANDGWSWGIEAAEKPRVIHGDGTTTTAVVANTALTIGTTHHLVLTWDGSNCDFYLDGVADGTPAQTRTITTNPGSDVTICDLDDPVANGSAARIGHVMFWDAAATTQEAISIYAGGIPNPANLKFWAPGWNDPGTDIVGQVAGTKVNTVTIKELPGITVAQPGFSPGRFPMSFISQLTKVIDETAEISEGTVFLETGMVQVAVSDTLELQDGQSTNVNSPWGKLTETMSDGTVWTTIWPPFHKRTQWS